MPRRVYKKMLVIDLNNRMINKGATNEALAIKAGVATKTIAKARSGYAVRKVFGEYIEQAITHYEFKRDRRGAQGRMM